MHKPPSQFPSRDADLLRLIVVEVRQLRQEVATLCAKLGAPSEPATALVAAIAQEFAEGGRFTARGLLELAAEQPASALARVLGELIDPDASPRGQSTQLGGLLVRLPELEKVAEGRGGIGIYRLTSMT